MISAGQADPDSQPAENPLGAANPPDQDDEAQAGDPGVGRPVADQDRDVASDHHRWYRHLRDHLANAGYATATGVQVTDLVPAGLAVVTTTPSAGTYNAAHRYLERRHGQRGRERDAHDHRGRDAARHDHEHRGDHRRDPDRSGLDARTTTTRMRTIRARQR